MVYERLAYGAALLVAAALGGPRRKIRAIVCLAGLPFLFVTHAYVAVLAIAVVLALLGRELFGCRAVLCDAVGDCGDGGDARGVRRGTLLDGGVPARDGDGAAHSDGSAPPPASPESSAELLGPREICEMKDAAVDGAT